MKVVHVVAVLVELAPLAPDACGAPHALWRVLAPLDHVLRHLPCVDHRHDDALGADVEGVADEGLVVLPDPDYGDGFFALHRLDRPLQLLDLHGGVLGVE